MKAYQDDNRNETAGHSFTSACLASCRKLIDQVEKAKAAILTEFRDTLATHGNMLQLALTEAEALAWETEVPHLVFPTLAREKAQAVAAWQVRQKFMQQPAYLAAAA